LHRCFGGSRGAGFLGVVWVGGVGWGGLFVRPVVESVASLASQEEGRARDELPLMTSKTQV
jgi:hypothetical protein